MRIVATVVFSLFAIFSLNAQNQQSQEQEQYEKIRQPFLRIVEDMRTSYPAQKYLKDLHDNVATNHGGFVVKLVARFEPLGYDTTDTAMRMVHSFLTELAVPLPANFFSLSRCEQKTIIELLALTYQDGFLWGMPDRRLPDNLMKVLGDFTNPDKFPEDVDEEEQQKLGELVNRFEKLAVDSTDDFSQIVFGSCSATEIERLFGPDQLTDQQAWTKAMKEKLRQKFEMIRLQLNQ